MLPNKTDSVGHIQIRRGKSAGLERTVDWAVRRSALNMACEKPSLGSGFGGRGTGNDCKILHCMVLFLTAARTELRDQYSSGMGASNPRFNLAPTKGGDGVVGRNEEHGKQDPGRDADGKPGAS